MNCKETVAVLFLSWLCVPDENSQVVGGMRFPDIFPNALSPATRLVEIQLA
jgi:hypothetical protein